MVIAIIAALAAILFPVFARAGERGKASACLSNCRQIGMAFVQYAQDNDDRLPLTSHEGSEPNPWFYTLRPYLGSKEVLRCPDDRSVNWNAQGTPNARLSSYSVNEWMVGVRKYTLLTALRSPAGVIYIRESAPDAIDDHFHPFRWTVDPYLPMPASPQFSDARNQRIRELDLEQHYGGLNNVYADGHVQWGQWETLWFQRPGVYQGAFDPRQ